MQHQAPKESNGSGRGSRKWCYNLYVHTLASTHTARPPSERAHLHHHAEVAVAQAEALKVADLTSQFVERDGKGSK